MSMRCNNSDKCDGIIDIGGSQKRACPHYEDHKLVFNKTAKPWWKVSCMKAHQCPKNIDGAFCGYVNQES